MFSFKLKNIQCFHVFLPWENPLLIYCFPSWISVFTPSSSRVLLFWNTVFILSSSMVLFSENQGLSMLYPVIKPWMNSLKRLLCYTLFPLSWVFPGSKNTGFNQKNPGSGHVGLRQKIRLDFWPNIGRVNGSNDSQSFETFAGKKVRNVFLIS